jgi:hydrogenase maturation protease
LVIGYGSQLRGDDAAGPAAARRLAQYGFSALDVHQLTPEIAEWSAQARVVFFLDADAGLTPGEVSRERIDGGAIAPALGHFAAPRGLLHMARVAYGATPEAWLIRMGCDRFELGDGLSAEAERAVSRAVEEVLAYTHPTPSGRGSETHQPILVKIKPHTKTNSAADEHR